MLCGEGRCLEERFVCDGTEDCGQAEDEVKIMIMVGILWLLAWDWVWIGLAVAEATIQNGCSDA